MVQLRFFLKGRESVKTFSQRTSVALKVDFKKISKDMGLLELFAKGQGSTKNFSGFQKKKNSYRTWIC